MTAGAYEQIVKTPRGARLCRWQGVAASQSAAIAEASLMRGIVWTAMLGPEAPPIPKIMRVDHEEGAEHPDKPAGMLCDHLTWEIDDAFSRQLEKFDYRTFAAPIGKAEAARLFEAVLRSDPRVAAAVDDGVPVAAFVLDRSDKEGRPIGTPTHPYGVRISAHVQNNGTVLGGSGTVHRATCHPTTLTALMAIALCHQNDPDRAYYSYYYAGEIGSNPSATLRAAERLKRSRGEAEREIEDAYAVLEGRGFAKLTAALRRRGRRPSEPV